MGGLVLAIIFDYQAVLTVSFWLVIGRKTVPSVSIEECVGVTSDHEIQLWDLLCKLYVYQVARMSQSNNNLNSIL